jgi:HK97 family phage portal protein
MKTAYKRTPGYRSAMARTRAREARYSPASNLAAPGFTASMTVPSVAGIMVTPQTALTFTAFFAGIKIISEDMARLPVMIMQRNANGSTAVVKSHRINQLYNYTADGECPSFNWRESRTSHVLSWGNGYAEIIWDDSGEIEKLLMIHPSLILPKRDQKSGNLYYELQTADSISGPRNRRIAAPWQIFHTAGLGFNGLVGYSVVALHREMIGLGKSQEQFGASFFGNGAVPEGYVKFARSMKPDAIKNFRENFNLIHQGSAGAHKLLILEEGAEWVATGTQPDKSQLIEGRKFQVIEVCRVLRLPPHKLGDFADSHYANAEAAEEDYISSCLAGWSARDEGAINLRLLLRDEVEAGLYAKYDFRPLLLRTAKDEADYYTKMFNIGYYSVDEMKALKGENPIGEAAGGGKRFVQTNLVDITKAGDPKPAGQEPKADKDKQPGRPEGSSLNRVEPYLNGVYAS